MDSFCPIFQADTHTNTDTHTQTDKHTQTHTHRYTDTDTDIDTDTYNARCDKKGLLHNMFSSSCERSFGWQKFGEAEKGLYQKYKASPKVGSTSVRYIVPILSAF